MKEAKVVILMKSGRSIPTTYNWEEMRATVNENQDDGEMVVEAIMANPNSTAEKSLQWVCVKKDEIEAYQNLV